MCYDNSILDSVNTFICLVVIIIMSFILKVKRTKWLSVQVEGRIKVCKNRPQCLEYLEIAITIINTTLNDRLRTYMYFHFLSALVDVFLISNIYIYIYIVDRVVLARNLSNKSLQQIISFVRFLVLSNSKKKHQTFIKILNVDLYIWNKMAQLHSLTFDVISASKTLNG